MFNTFANEIGVDVSKLTYHFVETGNIPYKELFSSGDNPGEEIMRKVHLSPELKKAIIPPNNKAAKSADSKGYTNIAQMRNDTVIGDSFKAQR